ncbi:tRNA (adenosine(37)-N6)-dimethylallyltransferase MiaA [Lachnobacterium bovis]|uniref:tRNA (adenosine(37)-N6)-dimethylallyltransferase MiaA n=1 Tax=Lachnobacterium bovis TaxID=140626 RepID=UPI0003B2FAB6|nr:tRNA (adenosine(37)-N6)-dimethylallyltransferase MiaA [Lachnobacterium bovis]
MNKKPLIVLTGPTAVGKTDLSIKLAHAINGAIISADSMQIYKYMDIGSAKVTKEEMDGVKHYLIDELLPDEEFNIVKFKEMALTALDEIYSNNQIPVVVGGTGFYIQALLYDIEFSDEKETNTEYRDYLTHYANEYGAEKLHEMLKDIDEVSYNKIHPNNTKRVIRAIEFYKINGYPISEHNEKEKQKESPYNFIYFVLNDDRQNLYNRINKRVDIMFDKGLLDEVIFLKDKGYTCDMISMQGIGYKEILHHLDGEYSLEHAKELIKKESRHFAKRQLTWFRREKSVEWLDKNIYNYNDDKILEYIINKLKNKQIIE